MESISILVHETPVLDLHACTSNVLSRSTSRSLTLDRKSSRLWWDSRFTIYRESYDRKCFIRCSILRYEDGASDDKRGSISDDKIQRPHEWLGCCAVRHMLLLSFFLSNMYLFVTHYTTLHYTTHTHTHTHRCQTSVNWSSGSVFWNHFSGGLCHQIEHHLFPGICHTNYVHIHPVVRDTCKEFGVPYQSEPSLYVAYFKMLRHLRSLGCEDGGDCWRQFRQIK